MPFIPKTRRHGAVDEEEEAYVQDYIANIEQLGENANDATHKSSTQKALEVIAEQRNSEGLKNFIKHGDDNNDTTVADAYRVLGISDRSSKLDPTMLQLQADMQIQDQPSRRKDIENALAVVLERGNINGGEEIQDDDTPQYPMDTWPVGLNNIGNTCYLNSLLQIFFSINGIRDLVTKFADHRIEPTEEILSRRRIAGEHISGRLVKTAQEFTEELGQLYELMITANAKQVRPTVKLAALTIPSARRDSKSLSPVDQRHNPFSSLGAINGLPVAGPALPPRPASVEKELPQVPNGGSPASSSTLIGEFTPDSDLLDMEGVEKTQQAPDNVPTSDATADDNAKAQAAAEKEKAATFPEPPTKPPPIPPRPQTEKEQMLDLEWRAEQHDAMEAMGNVINQIRRAVRGNGFDKNGEQIDAVTDLFYYKSFETHCPINAPTEVSQKADESGWFLPVPMADKPRDIYACLDDYFSKETFTYIDNTIRRRFVTISHAPPILPIMLQRPRYDRAQNRAIKNDNYVRIHETIAIDRYCHNPSSDLLERRQRSWALRQRLQTAQLRHNELTNILEGLDSPSAIKTAAEGFSAANSTADTPSALTTRAAEAQSELNTLAALTTAIEAELSTLFTSESLQQKRYSLHSVIFQRGGAAGGHYWCFIKDFQLGLWRKYNDAKVSLVDDPEEEIFKENVRDKTASPYVLVYVDEQRKEELTRAVERRVPEPEIEARSGEEAQGTEVEMVDVDVSG